MNPENFATNYTNYHEFGSLGSRGFRSFRAKKKARKDAKAQRAVPLRLCVFARIFFATKLNNPIL